MPDLDTKPLLEPRLYQALAELLGLISHADRIFILEELLHGEQEVKDLREKLQISLSRVSQHLGLLRRAHLVLERRQGRHVFYRLARPEMAQWLLAALPFIEYNLNQSQLLHAAVQAAQLQWQPGSVDTDTLDDIDDETIIYVPGRPGRKPTKK